MQVKDFEKLINDSLETGADFSELFYEEAKTKKYYMVDSKIDKVSVDYTEGLGLRIALLDEVAYAHTNALDEISLNTLVKKLTQRFNQKRQVKEVKFSEITEITNAKKHQTLSEGKKKEYLLKIDKIAREEDERVIQVEATFQEKNQKVVVARENGKIFLENRPSVKLVISIVAKENLKTANTYKAFCSDSYEFLDNFALEKEIKELVTEAIIKLSARSCKGGEMPVVIGPGFGAVIFHEACGHSLEATSVATGMSVLASKRGKKIASDKVTLIDDGSIEGLSGTTLMDDEGTRTRKNILIENGILKNYLIDILNNRKMQMKITGSGRRENYHYAPTSRMNNTYLKPGTDKIEDMIKSIGVGLYAKKMGGGSVDPITGDFNFSVREAYLIENGQVSYPVKGVSLIGNTIDILKNIEMVSDDLSFGNGVCGSESGRVPVTIGQPTIKVSKILVGGE